jgi:hypothetical protein
MANPHKGEIEFEIGGKTYTYLLGSYGLAKLEQRMQKPWSAILASGYSVEVTLAAFHAGLLLHHESITEKEASLLLDELSIPEFNKRFGAAMSEMFPDQSGGEVATTRPPVAVATNGIGTESSGIG